MATRSTYDDSGGLPVVPGVIAGVVAFVAGYLVTFLLRSSEATEALGSVGGGELAGSGITPPGGWQVIGWYFFQAHNVGIEASVNVAGQSGTETLPSDIGVLLLLVPVVLLVVAGFLVASTADPGDATEGAKAGLAVVPGYLLLAVLFALVTPWTFSQSAGGLSATASVGPNLLLAALLAGVVYPAVFGAAGGAAAGAAGDDSSAGTMDF